MLRRYAATDHNCTYRWLRAPQPKIRAGRGRRVRRPLRLYSHPEHRRKVTLQFDLSAPSGGVRMMA